MDENQGKGYRLWGILCLIVALIGWALAIWLYLQLPKLKTELTQVRSEKEALTSQLAVLSGQAQQDQEKIISLEAQMAQLSSQLGTVESQSKELNQLREQQTQLEQALREEIEEGKAKLEMVEGKLKVTCLNKVLFDTGKDEIRPDGKVILDKVAPILKGAQEGQVVSVEGHTDTQPIGLELQKTFKTNWELSSARALAVLHYFEDAHGLHPGGLQAVGHGEHAPVADNASPEGMQENRRVEIILSPRPASSAP